MNAIYPITVFYDGACGLCAREIAHYQRVAPADRFIWQDISHAPGPLDAHGISHVQALMWLHAITADGRLHVGVDAFTQIWRALPRWRLLALGVQLPVMHWLVNRAYRAFARWRFARLTHCQHALHRSDGG